MVAKIWAVGDSMTVGQGTYRTWWQRFADRCAGETAGAGLIRGVGRGGTVLWHKDTARDQIAQWLPPLLASTPITERPQRIIAHAGANNIHATLTADIPALLDAWEGLHDRLEYDYGIETWWCTLPPFRTGPQPPYTLPTAWQPDLVARRGAINTWLRSAMAGRGRLVDTCPPLEDSAGFLRPDYDSGDGLHPNTTGHVYIADRIPVALGAINA